MKIKTILGIDPGLRNTGYAVVSGGYPKPPAYKIKSSGIITTSPHALEADRFAVIYDTLDSIEFSGIDGMCIERVFFGGNVTSAITTGGVIAICKLLASKKNIYAFQLPPPLIKKSVGGGKLSKKGVQRHVEALTDTMIDNHHTCDAVAVAVAGILVLNSKGNYYEI